MSSVQAEASVTTTQDIPYQEASLDIWDKKYRLKSKAGDIIDQDINATYERVATALSQVEKTKKERDYWHERFLWALRRGAIPAANSDRFR